MASQGPYSPDTVVDDSAYGQWAWTTPAEAISQNDDYADAQCNAVGDSHYLKATDFDFTIPSGATIDGIIVEYDVYESGAGAANDARVRIVKGGSIGSTDKATGTAYPLADSDLYQSRGGVSDLWGETWSDTDINGTTFGVVISCDGAGNNIAHIDHIRITVYYTEGGGINVDLAKAVITATGKVTTTVKGAVSTALAKAAIVTSGKLITIDALSGTNIYLDTAAITANGKLVVIDSGSGETNIWLDAATIAANGKLITVNAGVTPVEISLDAAALLAIGKQLTVNPGTGGSTPAIAMHSYRLRRV